MIGDDNDKYDNDDDDNNNNNDDDRQHFRCRISVVNRGRKDQIQSITQSILKQTLQ